jgi:hypothetical protein
MNRQIKFRVWDTEAQTWVENQWEFGPNFINSIFDCEPDKLVFQQFTGLTDKNGKEIYEGDILFETIMGFKQLGVCKSILGGWKIFGYPDSTLSFVGNYAEVIGNIFENPELIKS